MKIYKAVIYERVGFGADEIVSKHFVHKHKAEAWTAWHLEDLGLEHDLEDYGSAIQELEVLE